MSSLYNEKGTKECLFKKFFLLLILILPLFLIFSLSNVSSASDSKTLFIDDYIVSYSYQDAITNNYFTLKINVTNNKNSIENLTLKMEEDDPFDFKDSRTWNIENLNVSSTTSKTFIIYIDDTQSKKYTIPFNLDDGNNDWDDEFEIRVSKDSPEFSLGTISSSPTKMASGQTDVALSITLKNTGDYTAEDLVATLNLPSGFTPSGSYSNEVHTGDINAGTTKTIVFYFDIDKNLEEKNYTSTLKLDYKNDGDEEITELDLPLVIFSTPRFEIIKTENLSELYPGATSKIKLSLKNTGKDAQDVTLRVYQRSDQPFEFTEKSVYIGSLKSNEIGYGIFEFTIDKDANPIKYYLDFQVRSIDGQDVIIDDITSSISVSKKQIEVQTYFIYGIIILTILIIGMIFLKKRKIKEKRN